VDGIREALLDWYHANPRPLGWRATRDPYAILVSEVMLQQTQAARVEPVWRAFLDRFPTVATLASAPTADVVTAWRGLGYNRRAVSLQRAAREIVAQHGGAVPADYDALVALSGIGPYTARAILAFAYEFDAAPVDTNVARVIARAVAGHAVDRGASQALADALVPAGRAWAWSNALMDLGSTICRARAPDCAACPLARRCAWRKGGGPDPAGRVERAASPPFAGSDRYHRGRLVDALRGGPVAAEAVPAAAELDDADRAGRLAERLVADGLAEWRGDGLALPEV
jgi:A/G-specific adenine glycosylase